jgi:nucleoside-diphosphate-sugar epimerase
MRKHILITGGLGFIGCHSVEKWKTENFDITIIDNMSSNALSPDHELFTNCNVILKNILDVDITTLGQFDVILHLASPVGPVGVLKHSGKMASIILDDIYWAIDAAKHSQCPLLFVSTSEIYGYRDQKSYLVETDPKVLYGDFTVRNEYSISKLLAEIVLSNTAKTDSSFKYQTIRPFNVSGKYQLPNGGFVLPRFINQALMNDDITVYYSGMQLRAFTWVKDIVDGIYLTYNAPEQYYNTEWNIGNEANETTILYLAEKCKQLCNSNSTIVHVDPIELHGPLFSEAPEKIPHSKKIRELLNWSPKKSIDEIILETVNYYMQKDN